MASSTELPLGHWPILDDLLGSAEAIARFNDDFRAQGELLYQLSNPTGGYWHLPVAHRQEVLSRLILMVPRIAGAAEPKIVMERIFRLWHGPTPREAIARAVRVTAFDPRPQEPWESIYDVGGFSQDFIHWTRESNCPSPFLFGGSLIALAGACGFNVYIDRNTDNLRLGSHYTIFTGKKGTYKSVSLDAAKELLHRMNYLVHPWEPGTDLPDFNRPNPFTVKFMPEDTNWRTIVGCLKADPATLTGFLPAEVIASRDLQALLRGGQLIPPDHGVLLLDEAATIFGKQNFAVDRMVPGMNAIWGGRPYVYQTQSGGYIKLERPSLTFAGCCPPDIMQSALTPVLFQGGLMDRMNIVHHEPFPGPGRFSSPRPRDPVIAANLAYRLAEIRRNTLIPVEMCGTPAALGWYDEWYHAQREPEDPRETSIARRGNHLWRYAAYIGLGNGHLPWVEVSDFEKAALIQTYELGCFREGLLVALEQDPAAELMDYLERVLLRHSAIEPDLMSRRDLFQAIKHKRGLSPPTLKAVPYLESLEQSGRIRRIVNGVHLGYALTREAAEELARGRKES